MSEEQLMKEIIKEQAQKIINLEQYLRIEKEVSDETIKELEQQKAELMEALRLSNNCINHAREYLKNKTDFRDNGLYKLRVISNEDLIKNIT